MKKVGVFLILFVILVSFAIATNNETHNESSDDIPDSSLDGVDGAYECLKYLHLKHE